MKAYEQTIHLLETLKLKGMVNCLDEELNEAEGQKVFSPPSKEARC